MMNNKFKRTGLYLAGIYLLIIVACVIGAQFITDPKGQSIILQLPVVLPHAVLLKFGLTGILHDLSWTKIYLLLGSPMLIILYLFGYLAEFIRNKISRNISHQSHTIGHLPRR